MVALRVDETRRRSPEQAHQHGLDLLRTAANGWPVLPAAVLRDEPGVAAEILRIQPRGIVGNDPLDRERVLGAAEPGFERRRCRRRYRSLRRARLGGLVGIAIRDFPPGCSPGDFPLTVQANELVHVAAGEQRRRPVLW